MALNLSIKFSLTNFLHPYSTNTKIMNEIINLLKGNLGKELIDQLSQGSGASPDETKSVAKAALPTLLGALQNNASSGGAQGILDALDKNHDGSILDDLARLTGADTEKDGLGILKHVLGNQQNAVQQGLSSKTGVSAGKVAKIMALLAPVVMGYLGKQKKTKSVNEGSGLSDLLGGLLGGNNSSAILGELLENFTGQDDGGKPASSISKRRTQTSRRTSTSTSGGLGGLLGTLGSLFGKKK